MRGLPAVVGDKVDNRGEECLNLQKWRNYAKKMA